MNVHRLYAAAVFSGLAVSMCCTLPGNTTEEWVNGKKYDRAGDKLYPMIRADYTDLQGVVHEKWITDYSSYVAPTTTPMNLPPTKPIGEKAPAFNIASKANKQPSMPDQKSSSMINDPQSGIVVRDVGTKHYITLAADVLFDFDKSNLTDKAAKVLDKVGPLVRSYGACKVSIAGHTDSKGTNEYNQTLSEKRADTVRDWLALHQFVNGNATTHGYGENCPVASNTYNDGTDYPQGRQKNRRVEIEVDTAIETTAQNPKQEIRESQQ